MTARAVVIWFSIVPVAIANGMVRDLVLVPFMGDTAARAVSSMTLAGAIVAIAWLSIQWIGPAATADAWRIGLVWLALTLAFELLVGHYVFGTPWETLRDDYNVLAGRLWILVLAAALVAPRLVYSRDIP